jgi:hypothetical protein
MTQNQAPDARQNRKHRDIHQTWAIFRSLLGGARHDIAKTFRNLSGLCAIWIATSYGRPAGYQGNEASHTNGSAT